MKIHNKVLNFAYFMQKELDENSHKGDWEEWNSVSEMTDELNYHIKHLKSINWKEDKIKEHLADCSNILMFIGNTKKFYENQL